MTQRAHEQRHVNANRHVVRCTDLAGPYEPGGRGRGPFTDEKERIVVSGMESTLARKTLILREGGELV